MIDLYTWKTPNGRKISIMLEETGMAYAVKPVDFSKGEQMAPAFLEISPNNKIPAIVDHDAQGESLALFESAAILTYLADKSGQFLAPSGAERYQALAWTAWQVGGLGPMMGQLGFFFRQAEADRNPSAIARFSEEVGRLLRVMEKRLVASPFVGGAEYSIADIACFPWMSIFLTNAKAALPEDVRDLPATAKWLEVIGSRPAVARGMAVPD